MRPAPEQNVVQRAKKPPACHTPQTSQKSLAAMRWIWARAMIIRPSYQVDQTLEKKRAGRSNIPSRTLRRICCLAGVACPSSILLMVAPPSCPRPGPDFVRPLFFCFLIEPATEGVLRQKPSRELAGSRRLELAHENYDENTTK